MDILRYFSLISSKKIACRHYCLFSLREHGGQGKVGCVFKNLPVVVSSGRQYYIPNIETQYSDSFPVKNIF